MCEQIRNLGELCFSRPALDEVFSSYLHLIFSEELEAELSNFLQNRKETQRGSSPFKAESQSAKTTTQKTVERATTTSRYGETAAASHTTARPLPTNDAFFLTTPKVTLCQSSTFSGPSSF